LEIKVIIVRSLDILLQVNQLIRFSQFNFDKRYDWPSRSCLFKLKEDLKHQEHCFDYQKVLGLIQTFHKFNQIWQSLPILLYLVTHWSNIVKKDSVSNISLPRYWPSKSIVYLLSFIYRLCLISILSRILTRRSVWTTSWGACSLGWHVRLRDRWAIEGTRIKVSELNNLILAIRACLYWAYRGLANVYLILC
jgi:hypothetical protein